MANDKYFSLHVKKAQVVACERGGYAGDPACDELWLMNKRELVELVLRLGALVQDDDSPEGGLTAARKEIEALRASGII